MGPDQDRPRISRVSRRVALAWWDRLWIERHLDQLQHRPFGAPLEWPRSQLADDVTDPFGDRPGELGINHSSLLSDTVV